MNVTSTVCNYLSTFGVKYQTRYPAWLTAHSILSAVRELPLTDARFTANFEVQCYCCGSWVNGTMIALDHVHGDGHADLGTSGKRLSGSKLVEAWYADNKAGRVYHTEVASCCANCNTSKRDGHCMCEASRKRLAAQS